MKSLASTSPSSERPARSPVAGPRRDVRTPAAVRGFDRAAALYERGRPDYPAAAIRYLGRALGLGRETTIVDLACGTGKLTRSLERLGAAIVGIEPTRGMRAEFVRRLPHVLVLDGTAERIPLPDGIADAVVVGQAFHWFRAQEAVREIARVLRPRGGLALLWNVRREGLPWMREYARLLGSLRTTDPTAAFRSAPPRGGWRGVFGVRGSPFGPLRRRSFEHRHSAEVETVVARFLSTSVVALRPLAERRALAERVRELLAGSPETRGRPVVTIPYRTDLYWTRRR